MTLQRPRRSLGRDATHLIRAAFTLILISGGAAGSEPAKSPPKSEGLLVTVNDLPLVAADLERLFQIHQVPRERRAADREVFLEMLIDKTLVRQFLARNQVAAPKEVVDGQLEALLARSKAEGKRAEEILARHGYPPQVLREELGFRLAWRLYVEQFDGGAGLGKFFDVHRPRFDGTEIRARQVLLRFPADDSAARTMALERLAAWRAKIVGRKLDFVVVAREFSEAPSATDGGDVGWFPFRGKMPLEVARAAFELKPGETSAPFTSPFGAHLVQVVEIRAGELSLEDVREEVLSAYSEELWRQTTERLRREGRIRRHSPPGTKGDSRGQGT